MKEIFKKEEMDVVDVTVVVVVIVVVVAAAAARVHADSAA